MKIKHFKHHNAESLDIPFFEQVKFGIQKFYFNIKFKKQYINIYIKS